MKYRTMNINYEGVDDINEILKTNCDKGWEFLGFGQSELDRENNPYILNFASFRHEDEDAMFFEG